MVDEKIKVKTYPLTMSQKVILYQGVLSPNKRLMQVPICLKFNQKLDMEILKKSVEIEYSRNDSLHLHFGKENKVGLSPLENIDSYFQYFNKKVVPNISVIDFTNISSKKQEKILKKQSMEVLDFINGDTARFILFTSSEGKYTGLFLNISHLIMDGSAIYYMMKDILNVYFAIKNNTEMPDVLNLSEVLLQNDLSTFADGKKMQKSETFFKNYYMAHGEPIFTGLCGKRSMKRQRLLFACRKDRAFMPLYAISNKVGALIENVSKDKTDQIMNACKKSGIPFSVLALLAIRSFASKVNDNEKMVMINNILANRRNEFEKDVGGCHMNGVFMNTYIEENMTVLEASRSIYDELLQLLYNADYPVLLQQKCVYDLYKPRKETLLYYSFTFAYFPIDINLPENLKVNYHWYDPGNALPVYIFITSDLTNKGGLVFNYKFRPLHINKKQMVRLHQYVIKFFEKFIENPDMSMKNMLEL